MTCCGVKYPVPDVPPQSCKKIWVPVKATKKSTCTDHPPYQVVTDDVEDVLDAAERDVSLSSQPCMGTRSTQRMSKRCNGTRKKTSLKPFAGK